MQWLFVELVLLVRQGFARVVGDLDALVRFCLQTVQIVTSQSVHDEQHHARIPNREKSKVDDVLEADLPGLQLDLLLELGAGLACSLLHRELFLGQTWCSVCLDGFGHLPVSARDYL